MTLKKKPTKTTVKQQAIVDRRIRALEMRKAGLTYAQIAKSLDVSERTVLNDIKQSVKNKTNSQDIERAVDLLRIEMAMLPLAKDVRNGDHKAIDRWKQLIDMKQKLLERQDNLAANDSEQTLRVKVVSEVDMEKI
ncbi:helix-turn-helix domain-containing protein [bacterium AH-315-I18]|nr:helix-turn-helix domain-containing protein [Phycisphaeraceae bacterium]MBN4061078.1 helix-turn-helix domain-containing protein [bacterium AH-315-I18]